MANSDKIRAGRNRTLTVSEEEIPDLKRIITFPEELSGKSSFVDLLINADALTVLDKIPDECASLIIIDPPYNLSKTFNSPKFNAMSDNMYEEYLRKWLKKVCDKGLAQNENTIVTSLVKKEEVQEFESKHIVEESFSGSLPSFLASFFTGKKISDKEANELKKLIDDFKE